MYCPNCGKPNSSEQKYCRACGLNLEDTSRSVTEQLPAALQDQRLAKRRDLVEKILLGLAGVGITAFVLILISTIIIAKGNVLGGIVFITFLVGMAVALMLVLYRHSLIEASAKRPLQANDSRETSLPPTTARQLADPYFEPVPSVTEPTTDLLSTTAKKQHDA